MSKLQRKDDAMRSPTKNISYGYIGRWRDGSIGWSAPPFLGGKDDIAERPKAEGVPIKNRHEPHYLCKITVEQVFDSLGRPIPFYPGGQKKTR